MRISKRNILVNLREEDYEEGVCGMLAKAIYGTPDEAQNWEYMNS